MGIDLEDPKLRAEWRQRSRPNLTFHSGDGHRLPFADGEFEAATAMEVLEHVPDPAAVLGEMARVSSRWLLVSVPREPLWRGLNMARGAYLRDLGNTPGHLNHWSKRSFARLLAGNGESSSSARRFPGRWRSYASASGSGAGAGESGASYGRGAALLSALIGVTGVLTYAFHSIAAHVLGADDYGLIAVLWAAVFLAASVIYRPVEQLLSRTIAERRAHGPIPIRDALRVAATIQLGLASRSSPSRCCCATRSRTTSSPATPPCTGA